MRKGNGKIGFTLIEMLVVIAIISILASMLTPSLRRALDTSRIIACTNNLKQIGIMFHSYGGDFNDHIPVTTEFGSETWDSHQRAFFGMEGSALEYLLSRYGGAVKVIKGRASGDGVWMCPAGTLSLKLAQGGGIEDGYGYWSNRRNNWTHANQGGGMNGYQSPMYFMYTELTTPDGRPPIFSSAYAGRMVLSYFNTRQPLHYCSGRGEMDGWNGFNTGRSNHEHANDGIKEPRPTLFVDGSVRALRYVAWLNHYESGVENSNYLHTGPYSSHELKTGDAGTAGGLLPTDYPAGRHKPFTYQVFDP